MAPQISLIVPTYRTSDESTPFFARLFNSLESTALSYELILVDDESPIPVRESEIESCGIENYQIIRNIKRRGANFSRNRGIAIAKSEIVFLLDYDDHVAADLIIASHDLLLSNQVVRLTGGCYREFRKPTFRKREIVLNPQTRKFSGHITPNGSGMAFRKADWKTVDGFNEKIFYGGTDREFGLRMINLHGNQCIHIFDWEIFHEVPLGLLHNFERHFKLSRGHVKIMKLMQAQSLNRANTLYSPTALFQFNKIDIRKAVFEEGFFYILFCTLGKILGRVFWSIVDRKEQAKEALN